MKMILVAAALSLAPAAFADDDQMPEQQPPSRPGRIVGVTCVSGGTGFGSAFGDELGGSFFAACNRAAAEAYYRCSGRSFRGPYRPCFGRVPVGSPFTDRGDVPTFGAPLDPRFGCNQVRCQTHRAR